MPASSLALLSVLAVALCAAFVAYMPVRRPHERSSWALAGVAAGLLVYYVGDAILYRRGLSLPAVFFWQKLELLGAGVAAISAVLLALTLRGAPIPRWERGLALALIMRALLDMAYMAVMTPQPQPGCVLPSGVPMLHCGLVKDIGSCLALLSVALTGWLFYRTLRRASDARRKVFMRYLLPAVSLIVLINITNLAWGLKPGGTMLPMVVLIVPAAVVVVQGLLRLEEVDHGLHLSGLTKALIVWMFVLIVSVVLDAWWLRGQAPILSILMLVTGLAAALAFLARRVAVLERQSTTVYPKIAGSAPGVEPTLSAASPPADLAESIRAALPLEAPRLSIYLFGPFRLERTGEQLPNHAQVWRSDKSKSLLAYLILARRAGVTRGKLIDALWPIGDDGDGEAEQRSLNALRSYLSTLRRILEPEKPSGAPGLIVHQGGRYRFGPDDGVWVDAWEFERRADLAQQLGRAGCEAEATDVWEQAVGLHGELGLLPDENYLPPEVLEPERERLRQLWLMGLRWLGRRYAEHGPVERAVVTWELVWRAVPYDADARQWLAAHYRRTGQLKQLAALKRKRE